MNQKKWITIFSPILAVIILGIALVALHKELHGYQLRDVIISLRHIPNDHLLAGVLFTLLSYFTLINYDKLAFYYLKIPMSYLRIIFAGFIGYVFSNNIGFALLTGGAVRYRYYSAWGVSGVQIAKIVSFCVVTFWLGLLTLTGIFFIVVPVAIPEVFVIPIHSTLLIGLVMLALVLLYFLVAGRNRPLKIRSRTYTFPGLRISSMQLIVGVLDFLFVGCVVYSLLPSAPGLTFPLFMVFFLMSQILGIVSNVPSGIGVFDALMIFFLSRYLPASTIMGTLVAYRAIYYIVPFVSAICLAIFYELVSKQRWVNFSHVGKS